MELFIIFMIGVAVGAIITKIVLSNKSVGTLKYDTSDPDGPYLFLEVTKDLDSIRLRKYITLKVDTKNYVSHE